jgi:hypothetical protein
VNYVPDYVLANELERAFRERESNRKPQERGPKPAVPAEERADVGKQLVGFADAFGAAAQEREAAERLRRMEAGTLAARERALESYDRLGLERPTPRGDGLTPSPALLLSLGCRVEEVDGRRVLVHPSRASSSRETRSNEMGR